jgi:hypothetical protein
MQNLQVSHVHLVRPKKLKSGKGAVRNLKTILNPKTTVKDGIITVDINHRWAAGRLVGTVDLAKGVIKMDVIKLDCKGYLNGRSFAVAGYSLKANITNTNRRARKA